MKSGPDTLLLYLLPDLSEHSLDDAGGLVAHLDDVPGRQQEAELARVRQLHGVAVLDVGPALGPVVGAPRGRVQHLGCRADLITHAVVEPPDGVVGNVAHMLEVLPVPGVQLVVAPGVEQVLPVAVECEVQLEVGLSAQQEVLDGLRLGLREGGRASECFLARISTGSVSAPVVTKVTVEINTLAFLGREILTIYITTLQLYNTPILQHYNTTTLNTYISKKISAASLRSRLPPHSEM